ncbi:actin binding protein [Aspergillus tubingensis]|uniref:Amine oxidase n=2 Tax=Aspergillus subgen. Circumdati TaxID=2720871 RepID=A0A100IPG7_ASPNG|nr:membrane copper amine oxidase [Aspergillus tubingensis]GAQ44944.1 membrane copper amine oxidase [Aspergillus niger]GFN11898.1 membrane copper amine oxidase [Aspergillus tubingensis]GLA77237.1 actin binding protein [Aspergillus tubingensis]GLA85207.1 actin binding protein [Aspergillus tubingensis]
MRQALLLTTLWLLLIGLTTNVLARSRPEHKPAWVRHGRVRKGRMHSFRDRSSTPLLSHTPSNFTAIKSPSENPWKELTNIETATVVQWLFQQPELNLTAADDAGEWDNTISLVELMRPNKSDVLQYLDHDHPPPMRYAHVVLDVRATLDPCYAEILVGPLPITDKSTTTWVPLEYPYTRKTQGRIRNLDADHDTIHSEWLYNISASIVDITLDLFNGTALGLDNDTIRISGINPLWQDDGRTIRWDTFWNLPVDDFDASSILPLGLFFKSDVTGRDPSKWKLEGWFYNNIFYETTNAFRKAYYSPGFVKLLSNVEGDWARTDQQGPILPDDQKQPPVMVAPSGARYALDTDQKYVTWMGFSFYIGFSRDTGVSIFDVRYKGQRILYELGLQEALSHYAGNDPVQSSTAYLDSYYGFGPYTFELVKGYDCPMYATYLNTSFYESESTHTHVDSLCLFEYDAEYPIQRHTTPSYVSSTKNIYLTLRSVSIIGNYDYTISYTFHLDGTIGIEVRASGYIQAAHSDHNTNYGYQVHSTLSGSMHDHILNFKADFDILGTANSIELTSLVPITTTYPWSNPNQPRNTMHLSRRILSSETESRLNFFSPTSQQTTMLSIINQDARNAYNEYRGYRILPSSPLSSGHLTIINSSTLIRAAHWSEHDIQITKQHDHEPRSAHPYNNQDVYNPVINFDEFFDGEDLNQTDLVVWINLAMHHVPSTGDLPNTVMTTAAAGVRFVPGNYFMGDQSRGTVNMVRVGFGDEDVMEEVETFGQAGERVEVVVRPVEEVLWE